MHIKRKVLVVGTTADYIDWIRRSCPNRALFLTDPIVRRQAQEPRPSPTEELLCDLSDYGQVQKALKRHLCNKGLHLDGIVAYDCESMELAAVLAQEFALPYPSIQAVNNCRNKYLSKTLWESHELICPKARLIRSASDAIQFFLELGDSCVLKPLSGSGSELIFRCDSEGSCETSFQKILSGLQQRRKNRLYRSLSADYPIILAEEFINGNEYSCDYIIEDGRVEIIRLARKIFFSQGPFGTARGYLLPSVLPDEIDEQDLLQTLYQCAIAAGISRAICMLDFMIDQSHIVLLELAPRPGGDCLPFLLRRCWNLDLLKLFLDFSQQRPFRFDKASYSHSCLGLRLHARYSGILKKVDARQLQQDSRVREVYLTRKPGHQIKMPPDDYDSWLLGHIIIEPDEDIELEQQCHELLEKFVVEIE